MIEPNRKLLAVMRALFVPLASLLLRARIDVPSLIVQLKIAFVQVARDEHGNAGKPASVKRVSELTGLSRKHVASLLDQSGQAAPSDELATPIESCILSTWVGSDQYLDEVGYPRELMFGPGPGTFDELVKEVTGENLSSFYLGRLTSSGCISVHSDNRVVLIKRVFSIADDLPRIIAVGLVPLATTIAQNWGNSHHIGFAQRVSHSAKIASDKVNTFRRISKERIASFLEEVDDLLSSIELEDQEQIVTSDGKELSRLGVGAYYFEIKK